MAQMKEERMKMDNDVLHRKIRMEQNEEAVSIHILFWSDYLINYIYPLESQDPYV